MKLLLRLMFFCILICPVNYIYAQQIKIGTANSSFELTISAADELLWFSQADSLIAVSLDSLKPVRRVKIDSLNLGTYKQLVANNSLYIINDEGSEIYKFNEAHFERLDTALSQKMQVGSTLLVYKKDIYRFGGYGFPSCRNFFTVFKENSKNWERLPLLNDKNIPNGSYNSNYCIADNLIYLFGGKSIDIDNSHIDNKYINVFDLESSSWQKSGLLNTTLLGKAIVKSDSVKILLGNSRIFYLDFKKNIFHTFRLKTNVSYIGTPVYHNGYFYFIELQSCEGKATNLILKKIAESDIKGPNIGSGKILKRSFNLIHFILTLLFCAVCTVASVFCYKKSHFNKAKKIHLRNSILFYKHKNYELNDDQLKILMLLLTKHEVTITELFDIINREHLHISHLSRILSTTIEELNFKLRLLTNTHIEFISFHKSDQDKRMKVYKIEKKWFIL